MSCGLDHSHHWSELPFFWNSSLLHGQLWCEVQSGLLDFGGWRVLVDPKVQALSAELVHGLQPEAGLQGSFVAN
jgi:hypothetical protein